MFSAREKLFEKAIDGGFLTIDEGLLLYEESSTPELMYWANEIRKKKIPGHKVTWMIDRNVNITNVCISACLFCNFHCSIKSKKAYITSMDEYIQKIDEMKKLGGNQLLLQGGMHPELGLDYYKELFKKIKELYPGLRLHALGPPEIHFLSVRSKKSYQEVLSELCNAGLDSLPGAGAEILSDRVRNIVSKNKCTSQQWLDVMREAHKLKILTSATMMFGHIETKKERIKHLVRLREVQDEKPTDSIGFLAFIPWPFQSKNTALVKKIGMQNKITAEEYIRTIAISRVMLPNIMNIQASWLTVGKDTAQVCLHSGANDFGSIMIEENVVSLAGASYKFDEKGIKRAISEAGFEPQQRDQAYSFIK